jgi:hypothetical protein
MLTNFNPLYYRKSESHETSQPDNSATRLSTKDSHQTAALLWHRGISKVSLIQLCRRSRIPRRLRFRSFLDRLHTRRKVQDRRRRNSGCRRS